MSSARKPPPAAVDGTLIAIDRWCPQCGAPAGKRCVDIGKLSRPPAKITHLARGWLDRPCRRCGAQPGERCRTPSGRDADPHTPRRPAPSTPASRRTATVAEPARDTLGPPASVAPSERAPTRERPDTLAVARGGGALRGELVDTADELVTAFSATLVARPQTRRTYERACRRFTRWLGPLAGTQDLTAANVSRYHAWLVAGARCSATVKKERAALNSFLGWLAEHEHVAAGQVRAALAVKLPRARGAAQRAVPHALSARQYERLVREANARIADDALAGTRDLAIVLVLGDAGLRCEELAQLDRQDFLAARKGAQLRALHVRHGKGDRQRRVKLSTAASTAIVRWERERTRAFGAPTRDAPLFIMLGRRRRDGSFTRVGGRCGQAVLAAILKRLGAAAQLPDELRHPHALRHTCATELLRTEAVNVADVRVFLRHASVKTTSIYLAKTRAARAPTRSQTA